MMTVDTMDEFPFTRHYADDREDVSELKFAGQLYADMYVAAVPVSWAYQLANREICKPDQGASTLWIPASVHTECHNAAYKAAMDYIRNSCEISWCDTDDVLLQFQRLHDAGWLAGHLHAKIARSGIKLVELYQNALQIMADEKLEERAIEARFLLQYDLSE